MSIAQVAQDGFKESANYDSYRPSYPTVALERLLEVLEVKPGATILDLGAGTGKFTQLLAGHENGYKVVAVEPHDGMRKELEQKQLRGLAIHTGTAESMPSVADHSVDGVVASQSFHWYANMEALREIHRVLKPAGVFSMIWNIEDYNAPKEWEIHAGWESTMRDVMWSFEDGHDRFRSGKWKAVFDEQGSGNPISLHATTPIFGLPIGEQSFEFERWATKEDVWKTWQTYSQVANLDSAGLADVEKTFWRAIDADDTVVEDGKVAVHGRTHLAWASSIPDEPLRSGG